MALATSASHNNWYYGNSSWNNNWSNNNWNWNNNWWTPVVEKFAYCIVEENPATAAEDVAGISGLFKMEQKEGRDMLIYG